jgi:tRNA 2-thiocytidine biosynthesis protein TtcA
LNDAGSHVVIRPLIYCAEKDLARFALERAFPILPCNLCGSQPNLQRRQVKAMLDQIEAGHPGIRNSMLAAIGNVQPAHLLDRALASLAAAARNPPEAPEAPDMSPSPSPARRRLPVAEA